MLEMSKINELDVIRLKDGRLATVLEIFDNGATYLVEIADKEGRTVDLPFVTVDDISEVV